MPSVRKTLVFRLTNLSCIKKSEGNYLITVIAWDFDDKRQINFSFSCPKKVIDVGNLSIVFEMPG